MAKTEIKCAALDRVRTLLGGDMFPKCESASLRLEKYVRIGGDTKKAEIDEVVRKSPQKIPGFTPKGAVQFVAKLGGRLIVNQAGGVLENAGLCLHPHFNAPYIPGSALKGIARHAAWEAWNEAEDGPQKESAAREVAEIFGYPTNDKGLDAYLEKRCGYRAAVSGGVCFMAAVPNGTASLVADLVNCHHHKYYSGDEEFADAPDIENPIPNFFPVVENGAQFVFTIVSLRGGEALRDKAKKWLVKAITENGAGAKTSAGYGWFEYDEAAEEAERLRKEKIAAEAAKAEAEEAARIAEETAKAAARAARAELPILEQWANNGGAAAACGKGGMAFAGNWNRATDDTKDAVVKSLQSTEGLGHDVWQMLRNDKKRKNQDAVSAVFKWCKTRGLGRMPQ